MDILVNVQDKPIVKIRENNRVTSQMEQACDEEWNTTHIE